jgi:hypothetical protein
MHLDDTVLHSTLLSAAGTPLDKYSIDLTTQRSTATAYLVQLTCMHVCTQHSLPLKTSPPPTHRAKRFKLEVPHRARARMGWDGMACGAIDLGFGVLEGLEVFPLLDFAASRASMELHPRSKGGGHFSMGSLCYRMGVALY